MRNVYGENFKKPRNSHKHWSCEASMSFLVSKTGSGFAIYARNYHKMLVIKKRRFTTDIFSKVVFMEVVNEKKW